jgi:stage IV sporulation protein FB
MGRKMESGFWKLAHWKSIPIYAHWTILLWFPWYLLQGSSLIWVVPTFFCFATILLLHELGHAIAARYTKTRVHAIRLFVMHGECQHDTPYYETEDILIAWGGVIGQLCLLVFALATQYLLKLYSPVLTYILSPIFDVLIRTNLLILAINLIPVKPLDGYIAWRIIPIVLKKFRLQKLQFMYLINRRSRSKNKTADAEKANKIAQDLFDRLKK